MGVDGAGVELEIFIGPTVLIKDGVVSTFDSSAIELQAERISSIERMRKNTLFTRLTALVFPGFFGIPDKISYLWLHPSRKFFESKRLPKSLF